MTKSLKLTLLKSLNKKNDRVIAQVKGLGLRHIRHSVVVKATPENQGMINKIAYMLSVEEV
jgi:large subunit ribosomal protein L30